MGGTAGVRRGISGDGSRPWIAIWLVLMDRAMEAKAVSRERRAILKASLGNFLLSFRRHPGKIAAWEIRDYLFRNGELGGLEGPQSLVLSMEAIAFFYGSVMERPALAEAALQPFEAGNGREPAGAGAVSGDEGLLELLREKLVENGAAGYVLGDSDGGDWIAR